MRLALILALLLCAPLFAIEEVQTDSASTVQAACGACATNGCATTSLDSPRQMNAGGTAGSSSASETQPSNSVNLMIAFFEDADGLGTACDAGTATTRLNVTTAGFFVITEICICQGSTEVGSLTGLSVDLTAGVKTHNITTSSVSGCASGPVRVMYCGNTGGSHGSQTYAFTPDQNHTIPATAPTVGGREGLLGQPITY